MFMYALNQTPDGPDKNLLLAEKHDTGFWLKGETLYVTFVNTLLISKSGPGYTEEDYLNDYLKYMVKGLEKDGVTATQSDIVKVTLGGKEYSRADLSMTIDGKEAHLYYYARRLDDNLIVMIECDSLSDKRADYYEKLFIE